ncbi:MAG: DUF2200 family protein [Oscillospiraceae bacterium]|nr:DUF2200 family protein [Oscillospiraceae bacterium]
MPRKSVFDMRFGEVYTLLVQKAERKGRTRAEVDALTAWLTGCSPEELASLAESDASYGAFLENAPAYNPRAELITGKVCGVQVESIEDPLMKRVRQLDKGRPLEKIMR